MLQASQQLLGQEARDSLSMWWAVGCLSASLVFSWGNMWGACHYSRSNESLTLHAHPHLTLLPGQTLSLPHVEGTAGRNLVQGIKVLILSLLLKNLGSRGGFPQRVHLSPSPSVCEAVRGIMGELGRPRGGGWQGLHHRLGFTKPGPHTDRHLDTSQGGAREALTEAALERAPSRVDSSKSRWAWSAYRAPAPPPTMGQGVDSRVFFPRPLRAEL